MEKEFVSYKQSVALKELGFNEPCLRMSEHRKICEEQAKLDGCQLHNLHCGYPDCTKDKSIVPVPLPLKQQAYRWIRDKYNKNSFIELVYDDGLKYDYVIYVDKDEDDCINFEDGPFNTYEEAENACIDKLIEIVKQQDK